MDQLPGGEITKRPLHFFWLVDCSGSMNENGKISALNTAIKDAIPLMREVAKENAHAILLVRTVKFSTGATWQILAPTPIDKFKWEDLDAGGVTDMGKAFSLVSKELEMPPMEERALPPVLTLISDGQPTDEYKKELNRLLTLPWGKKSCRVAIAIGSNADTEMLTEFTGNSELVLQSNDPDSLVRNIKWASTAVVKAATSPASQPSSGATSGGSNVPIPKPPKIPDSSPDNIIW